MMGNSGLIYGVVQTVKNWIYAFKWLRTMDRVSSQLPKSVLCLECEGAGHVEDYSLNVKKVCPRCTGVGFEWAQKDGRYGTGNKPGAV